MGNEGKRVMIFNAVIVQIFLLISITFAVSILLSEEGSAGQRVYPSGHAQAGQLMPSNTPNAASSLSNVDPGNELGSSAADSAVDPTTAAQGTTLTGHIKNIAGGKAFGGVPTTGGALVQGVFWGALLYGAAKDSLH